MKTIILKGKVIFAMFVITLFLLGFIGGYMVPKPEEEIDIFILNKTEVDELKSSKLKGSGSMIPLLNKEVYPNITIFYKEISIEENLTIGRIYIYDKYLDNGKGKRVIHVLDHTFEKDNITFYYFKGINNKFIDLPVTRENIKRELMRIEFK